MAKLIYTGLQSLDGYVADPSGDFTWAAPDEEVHAFVNELSRQVGTHLLGRRMYEVLRVWDDMGSDEPVIRDFAEIWRSTDKVVYSTSLDEVSTARTRLERTFDPEAVRQWKAESERDLSVGGPHLAAQAVDAGLVDEYHLFLSPVIVGGGNAYLPGGVRRDLELLDERRFGNGVVHLRYGAR